MGLDLLDPVKEILHNLPQSLKGIMDLGYMSSLLTGSTSQSDISEEDFPQQLNSK